MKWELKHVDKETDHRFLNYYTLHYDVIRDDDSIGHVDYYMASRHGTDDLLPVTHRNRLPDGVLIPLYQEDPKTKEISVLLTRQYRPAIGDYVNSVVAGLVDDGEDLLTTVRREASEEAGALVDDLEVLVDCGPTASGFSDETNAIVLGRITGFTDKAPEEYEDIRTRLVPLKDIPALLNDPHCYFALEVKMILRYLLIRFMDIR